MDYHASLLRMNFGFESRWEYMINKTGDLFTTENKALLHGVNTHGVMGSGIALPFKNKFPKMYEEYVRFCVQGHLLPGQTMIFFAPEDILIYNAATQDAPGPNARYEWIDSSVREAASFQIKRNKDFPERNPLLISMPRIGCGIGGLEWEKVEQILLEIEKDTGITFEVWSLE